MLVQIESNFNFKKRAIHLTRWSCYTVQSCKQDLNTFLCLYRAKEDNGCDVNEASNWHAANVSTASSFVLACERAMCMRSPYSLKSRGGSHMLARVKRPHSFKYGTRLSVVYAKWHWSFWYQIANVSWLSARKNITLCLAMTARPVLRPKYWILRQLLKLTKLESVLFM